MLVVLGGYGEVGSAAVKTLTTWYPGEVVIAGRDAAKCAELAQATGAIARPADVTGDLDEVLAGATVAIMCVERDNERVARACLDKGIHYVDVSASPDVLDALSALEPGKATAMLAVGVAPGLSTLLAQRVLAALPSATHVDVTIQLGLGEHHGDDAVRWTVGTLATAKARGRIHPVLPSFGKRTAFAFPFAGHDHLGVPVTTYLCFDSALATRALFGLRALGVFALARRLRAERLAASALSAFHFGTADFVVQAEAVSGTRRIGNAVSGNGQGQATGVIAALVARQLREGEHEPGIRYPAYSDDVIGRLGQHGMTDHGLREVE
ncbi:saccharopine dehydrogenase NADP-binding domain-containing protein [Amycolatopsis sp. NPDC059657]|uniref:saccharopine dehydrogenase NADP-binding domain-containing protein n=1 Tax=Amycolatopsis sp. NPDC059657 TaxID=3346899 RepID=UPI00366DE726